MEGFFGEKSSITKLPINSEQIDLTLKLSPCGQQDAEEKWVTERGLMRFGDLQTMRRVRTGKRLLLEKQRRAAAAAAAAAEADLNSKKLKTCNSFQTLLCSDVAYTEGGASLIPLRPLSDSDTTKLESPAKKINHVNPYLKKGDAMEILPSVSTTGDGHGGKRIEGLLYKYKEGQVCIVCVCHGSFLSPAEFVMHAGGKEVVDPMKHITIRSDSFYIKGDGSVFIS